MSADDSYSRCLFVGGKPNISRTALHIVASMKRDWMQTGRKPSGVCGAALYIAALSHGLSCSKSEIIEEFNARAEELEKEEMLTPQFCLGSKGSGITEVLCEHKKNVTVPFAHGLCERCYSDFVKLSGGLDGGSEPPAFQHAERERLAAKRAAEDSKFSMSNEVENNGTEVLTGSATYPKHYYLPEEGGNTESAMGSQNVHISGSEQIGAPVEHTRDTVHGMDYMGPDDNDESGNFPDIDDVEIDVYLLGEEAKLSKKIIWEKMNPEYEEKAAAKKADKFILANCSEDELHAPRLAAAANNKIAEERKEKRQKRAAELKNSGPAKTPFEATKQMLTRKETLENPKKRCNVDDSINHNAVKSSNIYPEEDETYEDSFVRACITMKMLEDMTMINTMMMNITYDSFPLIERGHEKIPNSDKHRVFSSHLFSLWQTELLSTCCWWEVTGIPWI
ncbi:hypothetical protein BC332_01211 [Capsicum chinense]|nr:hypothetical protein BC332_01211 [Capsicum chinense]